MLHGFTLGTSLHVAQDTLRGLLVLHRTHCLVIDVQPSFATSFVATAPRAAVTVQVEKIKRIVSAACRHAVVVEHTIEGVARELRGGWAAGA